MEIVRCSRGHFYDSEEHSTCPVCAAGSSDNQMLEKILHTGADPMPVNILPTDAFRDEKGSPMIDTPRPTEPADNKHQAYPPTEPVIKGNSSAEQPGKTTFVGYMEQNNINSRTNNPVPDLLSDPLPDPAPAPAPFNPVVGWLVCISGPSKGTSYNIHCQYNFIGRSSKMDISIPDDPHISAEKSAVIAYDDIERVFFFGPGASTNAVRVNGKMILNTTTINAYDVLTIGLTKLLFVPLCGDRFDWNETE